jgi:hypothetical protein
MLPTTIAADLQRQVLHYLKATFEFRDPDVQESLNRSLLARSRVCSFAGHGQGLTDSPCCTMRYMLFTSHAGPYPDHSISHLKRWCPRRCP